MRNLFVRGLILCAIILVGASGSLTYIGCSQAPQIEPSDESTNNANTDGGVLVDTNNNTNNNINTEVVADKDPGDKAVGQDEGPKDQPPVQETVPEIDCPPGCTNCKQTAPTDVLQLGAACERKTDKPNPCDAGKGLDCAPFGTTTAGAVSGTCLNICNTDDECGKIRIGLKCLTFTVGQTTVKACALRNKAGDSCNSDSQVFCETGNVCLISSSNGDGTCIKECANTVECPQGQVCRQAVTTSTRTFCLEPVLAGPKCIGEECAVTQTSTNCLGGLTCFEGVCVKPCDKAKGDADCDANFKEACFKQLFSTNPAYCRAAPTVTKVGEACNSTSKQCDDTKGLRCLGEICAKSCDAAKGEKNNPDCAEVANSLCKQAQTSDGGTINICQIESKANGRCGVDAFCPQGTRCINLTGYPHPTCFIDCDPCTQTRSGTKWVHANCDGGKTGCTALTYSDGRPAGGVCISSGNPVLGEGEICGTDPDKGCKTDLICVRFSSSPNGAACSKQCDPNKGEDKNDDCGGGRCGRLTNGGGVCFPQGNPVLTDGEFCGDDLKKSCLKDLICVTFSSDEDARGICSKQCDPSGTGAECSSGQCGRLTSGGGVCLPQLKRTRKPGERCRGASGTPHADDCLEKDGDKKVVCAPAGDTSTFRFCMIACDPANGLTNNTDCTAANLNNHFCLPDKLRPDLGACVEKCTFTNRLRCETSKCQYGSCQEKLLDSQLGQCLTADQEKQCEARGGKCENKTCKANACL